MKNPFKPSEIISSPNEFYGRSQEIRSLGRLIQQGSLIIQGSFGVGKSSLLSRTLLHMDGFLSDEQSSYTIVVGHGDIKTIDDAAQLILEELVSVDTRSSTLSIGIPKIAQYSSTEAFSLFEEGRHVAALNKILEDDAFKKFVDNGGYFIIAIDEAEKCTPALTRLFRQVITKSQLNGINNIRFIFSGVSPFHEAMIKEDRGTSRFIYEVINLAPFSQEEAKDFLEDKFKTLIADLEDSDNPIGVDPDVIDRIVQLSGGHPHLLQLLGSHVVEHEYLSPDGHINNEDLVGSLEKICYQTRSAVYESLIHDMKANGFFDAYLSLIEVMSSDFPGRKDIKTVLDNAEKDAMDWFVSRNIVIKTSDTYDLVDELLRVRVLMDRFEDYAAVEAQLITEGEILEHSEIYQKIWE